MKIKFLTFLLLAAAFLGGCATADRLNSIHIGMTKDQVVGLLGKPDSTSAQANIEYLTYYLSTESSYRDQPYSVRLVDGKVESFGRFTQLFDIYTRPVPGGPRTNYPWFGPTGALETPGAPAPDSTAAELEHLAALRDRGILTSQEFEVAKQRLISDKR
jgi:hypothetical protein